jgi:hypothetical protein
MHAFVTRNCRSTHHKALFDESQVVQFLPASMDDHPDNKVIPADCGHVGSQGILFCLGKAPL